jgi:hypothetical protein
MIVIDDDNFASNQYVIANLDKMSSCYVDPFTNANMVSDNDSWRKCLIPIPCDGIHPEFLPGREVLPHTN